MGRVAPGASASVPLARLLAIAYRSLIERLHERLAAEGWEGVRPAYGFVLLALRDGALTPSALAGRLDVTKQAASKLADAMVADGLVARDVHEDDARRRTLALTPRGRDLLDAVERIYADLERDWADAIGADALEETRERLADALAALHGGALPPVRPTP